MGITVAKTRVACDIDTPPYDQDITTADLGGLTPEAAFFIVTNAVADDTPITNAIWGVGAATATDERWTVSLRDEDAQGTTDNSRVGIPDECIAILLPNGSVDGEADFVSFITNGVRISWGNAPSTACLLTVILFAGTDLSAKAGIFTGHATVDTATDVTGVGFQPKLLLLSCPGTDFDDTEQYHAYATVGVAVDDGSDTQACWSFYSDYGQATSIIASIISSAYATGQHKETGWIWGGEIDDFDADGFSCISRVAGAGGDQVGYLALAFAGAVDVSVGIVDTPTSTGNQSITAPGFTPQFVMIGATQMPAVDTTYTDANAGAVGLSTFDGDDEYCNSIQAEDAQGTTDTQSLSDDTAVNLPDDDGIAAHVASFVSFDAGNGWTWNFSATEGTAVKYWYLAIEEIITGQPMNLRATTIPGMRQWHSRGVG